MKFPVWSCRSIFPLLSYYGKKVDASAGVIDLNTNAAFTYKAREARKCPFFSSQENSMPLFSRVSDIFLTPFKIRL